MQAISPVRFYATPWKPALAILLMLGDIAFGLWCLQTSSELVLFGYAVLIVCCPLLAFYLALFVVRALLRYPLLQIDDREWRGWASPFSAPQVIAWPEIAAVGIDHQEGRNAYRLAIYLKTPNRIPSQRMPGHYQNLTGAGVSLPLNPMFLGRSSSQAEELLKRISARFRREFERYGVQVVPFAQQNAPQ